MRMDWQLSGAEKGIEDMGGAIEDNRSVLWERALSVSWVNHPERMPTFWIYCCTVDLENVTIGANWIKVTRNLPSLFF